MFLTVYNGLYVSMKIRNLYPGGRLTVNQFFSVFGQMGTLVGILITKISNVDQVHSIHGLTTLKRLEPSQGEKCDVCKPK